MVLSKLSTMSTRRILLKVLSIDLVHLWPMYDVRFTLFFQLEQTVSEISELTSKSRQQAHNYESIHHEYDELQNTIEDWQTKHKQVCVERDGVKKELSDITDLYSKLQEQHVDSSQQIELLTNNANVSLG